MAVFRLILPFFVLAFFAGSVADGLERTDQFDEALIGEWVVASSAVAGEETKSNPPTTRVRITKNQLLLIDKDETELELDCRLDRTTTPQEIDLTFELDKGGRAIKMSVKGILKCESGKILLCFNGDPDGDRPKKFEKTTEENGLMMFELKNARTPK